MFNPSQPRGPDGKFLATGASRALSRAARSKANKKRYAKRRSRPLGIIDRSASRRQRGVGLKGLKKNFIPYARISKKSTTVGANTGTFLPGTSKRVVFGQYARIETVDKATKIDKLAGAAYSKLAPKGSKRALVGEHIKKNVKVDNPALRYATPGTTSRHGIQFRLGTSRKAGPTLTARRGTHKRSRLSSKSGIKSYNAQVNKGKKLTKSRPTRRKQAAARRNRKKKNT